MNFPALRFILASVLICQARAEDAAPPVSPPPPAAAITPATPTALFSELGQQSTKPLWRQQYRAHIERTVISRPKAALALGAIMADLSLATAARDVQQLRNLEQDELALEKLLGIVDKMSAHRQRYLMTADTGDWPNVEKQVDKAHDRQVDLLRALRDNDLANLTTTGQWLRAWQISTNVVTEKKLTNEQLSTGSPDLVKQVSTVVTALAEAAPANDHCLKFLAKKLGQLEKTWRPPLDSDQRAARLSQTSEILGELIDQLVQDQPASPAVKAQTNSPDPAKNPETTLPSR